MKFTLLLGFLLLAAPALATPIAYKAEWTAGDSTQTGFKMYWGPSPGIHDHFVDIGQVGFPWHYNGVVDYPDANAVICWVASAYNAGGESDLSNEICHPGTYWGLVADPVPTATPTPTATPLIKAPKAPLSMVIKKP